ncbi:hypothetical protein BH23BAC3_BH23BAC3_30280 [soil metagenome]
MTFALVFRVINISIVVQRGLQTGLRKKITKFIDGK